KKDSSPALNVLLVVPIVAIMASLTEVTVPDTSGIARASSARIPFVPTNSHHRITSIPQRSSYRRARTPRIAAPGPRRPHHLPPRFFIIEHEQRAALAGLQLQPRIVAEHLNRLILEPGTDIFRHCSVGKQDRTNAIILLRVFRPSVARHPR